jgi:hypothetical protein
VGLGRLADRAHGQGRPAVRRVRVRRARCATRPPNRGRWRYSSTARRWPRRP